MLMDIAKIAKITQSQTGPTKIETVVLNQTAQLIQSSPHLVDAANASHL
jgi:hypothetical protein